MKPLIGINVDIQGEKPKLASVQANYFESVTKAGGIPVLIPPLQDDDLQELLKLIDGILFIGGYDYCPSSYGEEKHESVELAHEDRIDFDLRLVKNSLDKFPEMPILGICAGAQALNIGLGGSLYQDIPTEFPDSHVMHSSKNGWRDGFNQHKVIFREGTKLHEIYKLADLSVPTSHHQALKQIGAGLLVTADAEDGIAEAIELPDRPFVIGVQWHPERDYSGNRCLFESFVGAAAAGKNGNK